MTSRTRRVEPGRSEQWEKEAMEGERDGRDAKPETNRCGWVGVGGGGFATWSGNLIFNLTTFYILLLLHPNNKNTIKVHMSS